jgi:sugar lactone lactonase YvrE
MQTQAKTLNPEELGKEVVINTQLELVFADDTYQLTGVAVSKEGRLFVCYPLWQGSHQYSLVEVINGKEVKPYPNEEMNSWKEGVNGKDKWVCVQAVYIDDQNTMWVVDPAAPQMKQVYQNSHKLVRINLSTNAIEKIYSMEGVCSDKSYINDVRVDTEKGFAYMTNSNEGGIIVVDLGSGKARQLLLDHNSVKSDPNFTFIIDGHELTKDGRPVKIQSDGIALTPDGEWLYYKPLTDNKLYRIRTEFLQDENLTETEVHQWVEDLGTFAATDGMICDQNGFLYLGDLQAGSILRIDKELKMTKLLQDDRLIWPDSYSISDDGYLYISCSQIQKQPEYNDGINKRSSPYTIYKMKLPS